MTRTRSILALAGVLTVVAGMTGCGGGGEDAAATSTAPVDLSSAPPEVQEAAKVAAERGLEFMADHDEIVQCAKDEGAVTIQTSSDDFEEFKTAFEAEYPEITADFVVLSGAARERFLLEAESGAGPNYDVGYPAPEVYTEVVEMLGYDLQGMAESGVLDIPVETIDPNNHSVASAGASGVALAYNRDLISEDELPTSWEELAEPRFGRDQLGMAMDVDLNNLSILTVDPEWGVDGVVELGEKMSRLQPVFTDSHTAATLLVQNGEVAISPFVFTQSAVREVDKRPDGPLQVAFIEPVPVSISESSGVFRDAEHPCAALLYIEWTNSDTAQRIYDKAPLQASFAWEGSRLREMVGDRETVIAGPGQIAELPAAISKIQAAFGFPTAP